jgi:hypothetical protein
MLELIQDMPENVVGIRAIGKVTGEHYEKVFIPALEEKLKESEKIRILYHLGEDLTGFTAGAMWDDAKVGIRHLSSFEKMAIVSDVNWITGAVKIFALVIPCPVKIFPNDQLSKAKAWVGE